MFYYQVLDNGASEKQLDAEATNAWWHFNG